jgi:hypothetical protein
MKSWRQSTLVILALGLIPLTAVAQWSVDLSRRMPASAPGGSDAGPKERSAGAGLLQRVVGVEPIEQGQEIVILNTERGFVPSSVRVRKDLKYIIYVVNVNEKERNVSFILDGFSETHATFFGQVRRFEIEPKQEGLFTFTSPETGLEGRLVVMPSLTSSPVSNRLPASVDSASGAKP